MVDIGKQDLEPAPRQVGFFAIFPILGRLLWRYGRRLFSVNTIVAMEKSQGGGSGERSIEDELLEQSLERNKHHYHVDPVALGLRTEIAVKPSDLSSPVLYVRKEGGDDRNG